MKKIITIALLLLVILCSFGFIAIRSLAAGSENNFFNRNYRHKVSAHPFLRGIFGLHDNGDGSWDYLGDRFKTIVVEVDSMEGLELQPDVLPGLQRLMARVTGKEVEIAVSNRSLPYAPDINREQLGVLSLRYRNYQTRGDTASVYLMYLSRKSDESDLVGLTLMEDGVVLFDEPLRGLAGDNPDLMSAYQLSTALHEFGHQLGLPHNDAPECLMNARVERGNKFFERAVDVVTDFCDSEHEILKRLRAQLL